MENSKKKSYSIPGAIVLAGVIIAGAVFLRVDFRTQDVAIDDTIVQNNDTLISADDDPMLGNPDAPVTFINFGDFRCQVCALFQRDIKPIIMKKYVKTGQVKYVYRDLITMGDNSILAAEAANCAGEQGKYWEYADKLHSPSKTPGTVYTEGSLSVIASTLGLNIPNFRKCLFSGKYKDEIEKDTNDGRSAGATGTPTVFINGRIIVGLNELSVYETVIAEELAKVNK